MIHVAGVDVGAGTAKAVILRDDTVISYSILKVTDNVAKVAAMVTEEALEKAGLSLQSLDYVVSTGYGRSAVSCANKTSSEII